MGIHLRQERAAAKYGVLGLTKALAVEFASHGITANAVSPGTIRVDGRDGSDPNLLAKIPVGFMGEPEDIAGIVAFLASPNGRFVTGQMIAANGGAATYQGTIPACLRITKSD